MRQKLSFFLDSFNQNLLIRGSFFAFLGAMAGNFFTYLFQLLMGRMLTPADYGTLTALRSVIPYTAILAIALQTTIVKKTSELKGKEQFPEIVKLFLTTTQLVLLLSVLLAVLFAVLGSGVASFLRIGNTNLVFWVAILAVVSLAAGIPLAFLQGLLRFKAWAFLQGSVAFLVLAFAVLAVRANLRVAGIFWGNIIAILLGLGLGLLLLRKNFDLRRFLNVRRFDWAWLKEIFVFATPTAVIAFSMMAFFNTDILLVKHFFNQTTAGIYSSAAILGRIIFFGTSVVAGVLLPVVSERAAKGLGFQKILFLGLGLVLVGALSVTAFYIFLPGPTIKILFGAKYLGASKILGWMGIFMTLYSVLNLLNSFFLSLGKTIIALPLMIGSTGQALGIWFFHQNLTQIIQVSSLTVFILIGVLTLYYIKLGKNLQYG